MPRKNSKKVVEELSESSSDDSELSVTQEESTEEEESQSASASASEDSEGSEGSESESEEEQEKKKRNFKRIDPKTGESIGRYTAHQPKDAASKGFSRLVMSEKKNGRKQPKEGDVFIRESTASSDKEIYGFHVKRVKLKKPQKVPVVVDPDTNETKNIIHKYRNVPTPIDVPEKIYRVIEKRNQRMKEQRRLAREEKAALAEQSEKKSKKSSKKTSAKSAKSAKPTKTKAAKAAKPTKSAKAKATKATKPSKSAKTKTTAKKSASRKSKN